jgi:luciferase family oxidoreductase group 1
MVPVSVLDLSPVTTGSSGPQALRNSLDLARHADRLGFTRYWVAEHHNMPNIASSAPDIMIGQIAAATSHLRVGSGGVMLPNHAPLVVAEQFGTLVALNPGRIDLGIGRAPGTDQITAYALRRNLDPAADDLPSQLAELRAFFAGRVPRIRATPGEGYEPELWLLGSSDFSARLAGELGLPFSFAHHFMPQNTMAALDVYRRSFRPSEMLEAPHAMIGVQVICADTDEHARWLATPGGLSFLRLRSGRPGTFPSPEEAAAQNHTPAEQAFIDRWLANHVIGSPETVRAGLLDLQARTDVQEIMVTTMVFDHADRIRSYELVAETLAEAQSRAA